MEKFVPVPFHVAPRGNGVPGSMDRLPTRGGASCTLGNLGIGNERPRRSGLGVIASDSSPIETKLLGGAGAGLRPFDTRTAAPRTTLPFARHRVRRFRSHRCNINDHFRAPREIRVVATAGISLPDASLVPTEACTGPGS
jgi:hypothetical protein